MQLSSAALQFSQCAVERCQVTANTSDVSHFAVAAWLRHGDIYAVLRISNPTNTMLDSFMARLPNATSASRTKWWLGAAVTAQSTIGRETGHLKLSHLV